MRTKAKMGAVLVIGFVLGWYTCWHNGLRLYRDAVSFQVKEHELRMKQDELDRAGEILDLKLEVSMADMVLRKLESGKP